MACKLCGVETTNGDHCTKCAADVHDIEDALEIAEPDEKVKFLIGLPDHLFFYGMRQMIHKVPKPVGNVFVDHLLATDRKNGDPVWQRLRDYRGGREGDRWDTNPLLA